MIPLLHLTTLVSAFFCLFAVLRLYSSYKKTKNRDVGDFLKAFVSLGVYFFLVSIPVLPFVGASWVQALYIAANAPIMLSALFLFRAGLRILGFFYLSKIIFFLTILLVGFIVLLGVIFFSPATQRTFGIFYHWGSDSQPFWLVAFTGFSIMLLAIGCSITFFLGGLKSGEKFIKTRSFLIGGGIAFLIAAAFLNWIIPHYLQGAIRWVAGLSASFVALLGLFFMLWGVYYKETMENR